MSIRWKKVAGSATIHAVQRDPAGREERRDDRRRDDLRDGEPVWSCFKQLANAGITRICFGEFYRDERIFEVAKQIHIELVHVPLPGVSLPKFAPNT